MPCYTQHHPRNTGCEDPSILEDMGDSALLGDIRHRFKQVAAVCQPACLKSDSMSLTQQIQSSDTQYPAYREIMPTERTMIDLGPGLTPREAASDAILRCVQSLDENNEEPLRSAFTNDGVLDLSGLSQATGQEHPPQDGIDNIVKGVFAHVGPMDSKSSPKQLPCQAQQGPRSSSGDLLCSCTTFSCRRGTGP